MKRKTVFLFTSVLLSTTAFSKTNAPASDRCDSDSEFVQRAASPSSRQKSPANNISDFQERVLQNGWSLKNRSWTEFVSELSPVAENSKILSLLLHCTEQNNRAVTKISQDFELITGDDGRNTCVDFLYKKVIAPQKKAHPFALEMRSYLEQLVYRSTPKNPDLQLLTELTRSCVQLAEADTQVEYTFTNHMPSACRLVERSDSEPSDQLKQEAISEAFWINFWNSHRH